VTANKKQHSLGETVIISNDDHFLSTQYPSRDADETITGQWTFTNFPITASTSFASETILGSVELATGQEAASSTALGGTGYRLALPTSISTTTPGTAYTIPVTGSDGKIDSGFVSTSSVATYAITNASTSVFSTAGTSTYTKVSGLKFIIVEIVGGGGGGGNPGSTEEGGGGGAGGYARKTISASDLSATTSITVGAGAATELGGNPSYFGSVMTANGGARGLDAVNGVGGSATGGDVNITGQSGFLQIGITGGPGGLSALGLKGSGGIGATNGASPGSGYDGVVIITEYF
jgi:hypothetical protein